MNHETLGKGKAERCVIENRDAMWIWREVLQAVQQQGGAANERHGDFIASGHSQGQCCYASSHEKLHGG